MSLLDPQDQKLSPATHSPGMLDFPGGSVAKIQPSQCRVPELNPWSENWIPTCHMPQLRVHMPRLGKTKILVELQ